MRSYDACIATSCSKAGEAFTKKEEKDKAKAGGGGGRGGPGFGSAGRTEWQVCTHSELCS